MSVELEEFEQQEETVFLAETEIANQNKAENDETNELNSKISELSKRGYQFYGCDNYPQCNFMTWDKPTEEKCPKCGKSLFKGKGGMLSCLSETCDYQAKATRKKKETEQKNKKPHSNAFIPGAGTVVESLVTDTLKSN